MTEPQNPDAFSTLEKRHSYIRELELENRRLIQDLRKQKRKPSTRLKYLFVVIGIIFFALAVAYQAPASLLAFIGLGFVFYGVLVTYITAEPYVHGALIEQSSLSLLRALNQLLHEYALSDQAVYIPSHFLKESADERIFVRTKQLQSEISVTSSETNMASLSDMGGLYLTPPGLGLINMFEDRIGKRFTEMDLPEVGDTLTSLFLQDFEIAENFQFVTHDTRVEVSMENSLFITIIKEIEALDMIFPTFGDPFTSAIALAITRSTQQSVFIEAIQASDTDNRIEVSYVFPEN